MAIGRSICTPLNFKGIKFDRQTYVQFHWPRAKSPQCCFFFLLLQLKILLCVCCFPVYLFIYLYAFFFFFASYVGVFWQGDLMEEHMFDVCVCFRWNEHRRLNAHRHANVCVHSGIVECCQSISINDTAMADKNNLSNTVKTWLSMNSVIEKKKHIEISITIKMICICSFDRLCLRCQCEQSNRCTLESYGKTSKFPIHKYLFRLFNSKYV